MKKLIKNIDGFNIYFEALEEHGLIDENFSDDEELRNETIKQLNNHELIMFCAKITAEKGGVELADDYLGMCIYENEEDFYIKYKDNYFQDMCNTVVSEAKKELPKLLKELNQ